MLLVWSRDLLLAFGASANTIDYAADYMRVYAMGTLFVQLTLGMNAFITAQGFATGRHDDGAHRRGGEHRARPGVHLRAGHGRARRGTGHGPVAGALLRVGAALPDGEEDAPAPAGARTCFIPARLLLPCIALGLATFVMQASESVISVCFNASLLKYGGDIAVGAMTILSSVMQFAHAAAAGHRTGLAAHHKL